MGAFHHEINFKAVRASNIRVGSLLLCYFSARYSHLLLSNFPTKTAHPSHSSHPILLNNDLHNYLLLKMNNNFVCDKWCVLD